MSEILKCFTSRYGNAGVIIEADYSQLEVIALAILSEDPVLTEDLKRGIDMHCMNASFLYDQPYHFIYDEVEKKNAEWIEKRKMAKAPGFLIQYGGGARTMAKQTKLSEVMCKRFIKNYYDRYFIVKAWQDEVMREVQNSRWPTSKKHPDGSTIGKGKYSSITGRVYTFEEQYSEGRKYFSPTQVKNYPVQGFATGDIVPMMLGKLYKTWPLNIRAHLINTVHDSVIIDCHINIKRSISAMVKVVLQKVPLHLEEVFGIETDLEFPVNVSIGSSWAEAKKA